MNVEIKKLESGNLSEFQELIALFERVFEMKDFISPPQQHLLRILQNPDFICLVACKNEKILGGLTIYVLHQYYATRPLAYIYDLAVDNAYQRKGIGKQLISEAKRYCRENGFEEVFVQADKGEANAVNFYHATQPSEAEEVIHFYYLFE